MTEPATKEKKMMMIPDWTKLPEELIQMITNKMNCFDVVHARSVSTSWRSTFPFPASLLRSSYSLPTYPLEKDGLCSVEKIPFVLVIDPTPTDDVDESASEIIMGLVGRDESADYVEAPSPLQCSLRVKKEKSDSTLMNVIGSQIVSLGYQHRMVCWDTKGVRTTYKNAAILPLNREGGRGEFVVLRRESYSGTLLALTSAKRKWVVLPGVPSYCTALVTFRGRFYACFFDEDIYVIHPYSLAAVRLIPPKFTERNTHLITAGDDELFLVKKNKPNTGPGMCKVSRLVGLEWVEVDDLGDRVLFVGKDANVCCSANQLPDGCGVTGNSILFAKPAGNVTCFHKYGPPEIPRGKVVGEWRKSRERRVKFLDSHKAFAFRVGFELSPERIILGS